MLFDCSNFGVLLIISLIGGIFGICPDKCICAAGSIVCSCNEFHQPSTSSSLALPPASAKSKDLHLADFSSSNLVFDLFVVHSCDKVLISNDTFAGLEIKEQLKFLDIGKIEIEPFAFRGIKKPPKQLIIQNSNIQILPGHAFTGLTEIEHFFMVNVSIKRIEKFAFSKVANFNYIYFRNVHVDAIDSEAFGNMHHINYFYMRENITLSHVDDSIFQNSHINELMFENSNVKATDFSLSGIFANKIEIISTKWHTTKTVSARKMQAQNVENFYANNSTFNRIVPGILAGITSVIIEDSQIHHFASLPNYYCKNTIFAIKNSRIFQWHSHAISANSKIEEFILENSKIERLHSRSIYDAKFETFKIYKTTFDSTIKKFIDKINATTLMMNESRFDGIFAAETFGDSNFNVFLMNENVFQFIEPKGFGNIVAEHMQISSCTFMNFPKFMFENSNITDLTILSSHFQAPPPKEAFSGLNAIKLQFTHSDIVCNIHDCEINSLFFQPTTPNHNHLSWKFEYNRCISSHTLHLVPSSLICKNATEIITDNGLLCQRRIELEECICIGGGSSEATVIIPSSKASILTIGDCESVSLLQNLHMKHLRALYLYRIQMISVQALPYTLQKLEILHSTIRFEKPHLLQNPSINELKFSGTIVEEIHPKAFANGYIKSVIFNQSVLLGTSENAFQNTVIEKLNIDSSEIIAAGDLFSAVKYANIKSSKLKSTLHFSNIPFICLQNNTIDCQCSSEAFFELPNNRCPTNSTNFCFAESANHGYSNEYWRKARNIFEGQKLCKNGENFLRLSNGTALIKFEYFCFFMLVIIRCCCFLFLF